VIGKDGRFQMRTAKVSGGRRQAESHGYLASVSDLMTVLLFVSMIATAIIFMWTELASIESDRRNRETTALNDRLQDENRQLMLKAAHLLAYREQARARLARLARLEDEFGRLKSEILDSREARSAYLVYIRDEMKKLGKNVEIDSAEGVFRIQDGVLFDTGQYTLKSDEGEEALDALAHILSISLPCYVGTRNQEVPAICVDLGIYKPGKFDVILIEGHTDDRQYHARGKIDDNLQLSMFRSWATFNRLMQSGPSLGQLKNGEGQFLFGMSGYGENRPVEVIQIDENQKRRNRRVDFRIVLAAPDASLRGGAGDRASATESGQKEAS
jgi:flagellar motor protein MotB